MLTTMIVLFVSLQIISDDGLEIWEYDYDNQGRLKKELYQRRGALVRISFFPSEVERIDELYRSDKAFLRVTWHNDMKLREEVLNDGRVIKTRDFQDGVASEIEKKIVSLVSNVFQA